MRVDFDERLVVKLVHPKHLQYVEQEKIIQ
jgi:hypothetical protein